LTIIEKNIKSPCNSICKLDKNNVCIGCKRTIAEIASWSSLSNSEKQKIIDRVENE
jgi:predicted Fe-S protein YdhL (DUF1289 family)